MIFVYIILCHVKRLCYTPTLVYITLCYTMCIYIHSIPLWYMTIYITSHTILIYYNNYYYDNCNSYLFLFLFFIIMFCICVCVYVLCCVVSLVCMCALLCILAYAHTCVSVCVYPASPSQTVLWWRGWCVDIGGYISGKNFYKIWKMGIPGKNRPQEHFWFEKTVKTLDKTVQMCYNINIETKGDWYYDETRLLNNFSRRKTRFSG